MYQFRIRFLYVEIVLRFHLTRFDPANDIKNIPDPVSQAFSQCR